jgi:purine-binding chemotaxis protein CheW
MGCIDMLQHRQYVVFKLDDRSFCLYLTCVRRVIRVVETAALPGAPQIVMGILNLNGEILPVVNIRKRFGLPEKELNLSDQLIIAATPRRSVAILVDVVTGVIEIPPEQVVPAGKVLPASGYIAGVIKLPDGMVLIHDLDSFLSLEEEQALSSALTDLGDKA